MDAIFRKRIVNNVQIAPKLLYGLSASIVLVIDELARLQEIIESGSKVSAYRRWLKAINRDKRCIATHVRLVRIEFLEKSG